MSILLICLLFSCRFLDTETSSKNPTFDAPDKTVLVAGYVSNVISGDTIEVKIDNKTYLVRYIGIQAPKIDKEGSEPESYSLQAWIANQELVDQETIYLEQDKATLDSDGALLRYAWTENGTLINASMVSLGLAHATPNTPNLKYAAGLDLLQTHAKDTGQGLWKPFATQTAIAKENR